MTAFTLKPFPGDVFPASLEIVGNISRQGPTLFLHYEIRGNLEAVALPEAAGKPARRDGLWQETCFEFFFGQKSDPGYWEVNLSPAGHWNVYRFAAYRQGMAEEAAFATLPFGVQRSVGVFRLNLDLDLAGIITRGEALDAAVSAVIQDRDGRVSYWALAHPGQQADFHRREAFIIELC